ncbi:MAG: NADH-quinone oxidoreductase subunit M [Actinomycetota bacterium]
MNEAPILTLTLFLPLAGAALIALTPADATRAIRVLALFTTAATFAVSLGIPARFDAGDGGFQLVEQASWVPGSGASYRLGVDGISLWLVLLVTFLMPISVLASWNVTKRVKAFHIVMLVLEVSMVGVFVSLDLILFYVFWEGMLIPMYFLIGVWGYERRVYAAMKFFLYTLAGSLLMLGAVLSLYFLGGRTFDLEALAAAGLPLGVQHWLFAGFFASFAVKVPIWPFHTWLPDAHTEAPTAGSVLLAGVLLKMGAYGFLRLSLPLFPDASRDWAPWLAVLGVIGILYGGLVSIVQRDIKRLVAYSSVSHLGFVVLGIAALTTVGLTGSVLQMVNHGLSTGALFLLVGMLYERAHTRSLEEFRGLAGLMPVFAGAFLLVSLSSLGLPGLNGFVGEFLILNGAFQVWRVAGALGALGIILAAVYLLWAYERMFTGKTDVPHEERRHAWRDISLRERVVLAPLVAMILVIGVFPKPFLDRISPSVERTLDAVNGAEVARR